MTLSGGEPLLQPAFAGRIFRHCQSIGLHTALDTSGFLGARADDALLDDIDLVLLDVKSGLPETYRKVTGRELAPTLAFGRRLAERGTTIWIRFVLVPESDRRRRQRRRGRGLRAVAAVVGQGGAVERVEILPFHQMGTRKWKAIGEPYPLENTKPPSKKLLERVRGQFRARGVDGVLSAGSAPGSKGQITGSPSRRWPRMPRPVERG